MIILQRSHDYEYNSCQKKQSNQPPHKNPNHHFLVVLRLQGPLYYHSLMKIYPVTRRLMRTHFSERKDAEILEQFTNPLSSRRTVLPVHFSSKCRQYHESNTAQSQNHNQCASCLQVTDSHPIEVIVYQSVDFEFVNRSYFVILRPATHENLNSVNENHKW